MGLLNFPRAQAWCVVGGTEIGIVHEWPQVTRVVGADRAYTGETISDPTMAEVHLVNVRGETIEERRDVPVATLRECYVQEIPAPRRPALEDALTLGYREVTH